MLPHPWSPPADLLSVSGINSRAAHSGERLNSRGQLYASGQTQEPGRRDRHSQTLNIEDSRSILENVRWDKVRMALAAAARKRY